MLGLHSNGANWTTPHVVIRSSCGKHCPVILTHLNQADVFLIAPAALTPSRAQGIARLAQGGLESHILTR